ncbi:hypothetical protein D3C71_1448230 [compost metagenome]
MVCRQQRVFEELRRIIQLGARQTLEIQRDRLQRQLGGNLAFGVTAHAIGNDEQTGLLGVAVPHPVFVLFPTTLATELEDRELHLVELPARAWIFFLVSLTSESIDIRTFSETVSLV